MGHITRDEILKGREVNAPLTAAMEDNLTQLLRSVNLFLSHYKNPVYVSSGYRPEKLNVGVGGSKRSAHLTCEAVDLIDHDDAIKIFCLENIPLLEKCGLWMEHPNYTPSWTHLQIRPTKKRVFIPYYT